MHIRVNIPASVLDEVKVYVDNPVGHVHFHVEDDWLIVKVLASTIKFRPSVQTGQIVLQDIAVSGLLWPVQSRIRKSLEESTGKMVLPNVSMSINAKEIQIVVSVDLNLPPFLRKFVDKAPQNKLEP